MIHFVKMMERTVIQTADYISILQKMLNKYKQKPDVYSKLLTLEAKILTGRYSYESYKR